MRWVELDTRHLETIQGIVDGFIHIMPERAMGRHWVESTCWCEPRVAWSSEADTIVVQHFHKKEPEDGRDASKVYPKSRK